MAAGEAGALLGQVPLSSARPFPSPSSALLGQVCSMDPSRVQVELVRYTGPLHWAATLGLYAGPVYRYTGPVHCTDGFT
jgi:hypothetical protein